LEYIFVEIKQKNKKMKIRTLNIEVIIFMTLITLISYFVGFYVLFCLSLFYLFRCVTIHVEETEKQINDLINLIDGPVEIIINSDLKSSAESSSIFFDDGTITIKTNSLVKKTNDDNIKIISNKPKTLFINGTIVCDTFITKLAD